MHAFSMLVFSFGPPLSAVAAVQWTTRFNACRPRQKEGYILKDGNEAGIEERGSVAML